MTTSPYIIAEMACSHEGDPTHARTIIDGAGAAGASAIQFQIWKLEEYAAPTLPNFETLKRIELSRDEWRTLFAYSKQRYPTMEVIGCVSEIGSLEFCEELGADAYKIHAGDLLNPRFIKRVAATGKRIDLAVGASTKDEVSAAISWIRETSDSVIWLLFGFQNFPTSIDDARLLQMLRLKEDFGLPVGYQDHCDAESDAAFWLPAAAMGMGITIQEKHITHDRSAKGIDHEAALNPDEFADFVRMCHAIETAKGENAWMPFSPAQEKYRAYARKSLVASRDLPAGTVLQEADMLAIRSHPLGAAPQDIDRLIGTTTTANLRRFDPLHLPG